MDGTLEFDGVRYPDGRASDPRALGWMQGTPPAEALCIRFADDRFLSFPQIRWSLSHMRELVPTVNVWRGEASASPLGDVSAADEAAIDDLAFTDMHGRPRRFGESLFDVYTDGIVVLHRGRRVYERYFGALAPQVPHSCFSITKSYAATLCATLVHEGALDDRRAVPHYLPEMRATAYADATLRQVMDMQIGVSYSELYADPKAHIWDYSRAGGLRPRPAGYSGPASFYEYLQTLQPEGTHAQAFAYKTVNTELMCWIMKRVTGRPLADMLSERLWSQLGCEQDAYLTVDPIGVPMGGGGLHASLRDLARFGELMRREGDWHGRQLVPAEVVRDIARGDDPAKFAKAGYTLLPGYSYRSMWWVSHNELGAFEGRGIHGQRLYVAPKAEMVVARFASHPVASSAANDPLTLPALLALGRLLQSR
ncbi:serine hydrolase [Ramlibacter solisilvae]|uniref:6-aminohexanoate hydrolase n=1 Tax=Ramlibacter tataouinensis TaxID=94132 RepID=A0A127JSC9_9BURK|nr:serine hydrolase [Ramlibacter tataouinensis]AMO22803.1 6-aminohexanoate hydrolase [Ramlibacter tataouinensis]